jgi:hypothetical protein
MFSLSRWTHLQCVTPKIISKIQSPDDIAGFDILKDFDQAKVRQALAKSEVKMQITTRSKMNAKVTNAKVPSDEGGEKAGEEGDLVRHSYSFLNYIEQTSKYQAQSSQGKIIGHDQESQGTNASAAPAKTSRSKSLSDATKSLEGAVKSLTDGIEHLAKATRCLAEATKLQMQNHDPMVEM